MLSALRRWFTPRERKLIVYLEPGRPEPATTVAVRSLLPGNAVVSEYGSWLHVTLHRSPGRFADAIEALPGVRGTMTDECFERQIEHPPWWLG